MLQLEAEVADRLGRRLKKVTGRLGEVRELDVLAGLTAELQESGEHDPQALRRVASVIAAERLRVRDRLCAKLPTAELERIARKLEKIAAGLHDRKPSRGWQWAVEARVSRRAETVTKALAAAGSLYMPERLHAVRIALKKLRYAVEVAGEAAGVKTLSDLKTLKRQQDILGRLHDVQVLIEHVRQMQGALAQPDATMWRKIDALLASLENDCRRLHAKFMHQRDGIRAICDRVSRATGAAPQARRALAG